MSDAEELGDDAKKPGDDAKKAGEAESVPLFRSKRVTLAFDGPELSFSPGHLQDAAPGVSGSHEETKSKSEPTRERARPSEPASDGWGRSAPATAKRLTRPSLRPTGDALSLVAGSKPPSPRHGSGDGQEGTRDWDREMHDRFALDDFTGALRMADLLLGRSPGDQEASRIREQSTRKLESLYRSRLGGSEGRIRRVVATADVRWLGLDSRAGFLLSRVDGELSVSELVDVSGMAPLEALRTLVELMDAGALALSGS